LNHNIAKIKYQVAASNYKIRSTQIGNQKIETLYLGIIDDRYLQVGLKCGLTVCGLA